jgi:hypothetical protein
MPPQEIAMEPANRTTTKQLVRRGSAEWRGYRCILHEGPTGIILEVLEEGRVVAEVQLTQGDDDPTPTLTLYKRWPVEDDDEIKRVTVSL